MEGHAFNNLLRLVFLSVAFSYNKSKSGFSFEMIDTLTEYTESRWHLLSFKYSIVHRRQNNKR